jgi:hypothetical protein
MIYSKLFYPIVIVSLALIIWQLYPRRGEPLDGEEPRESVLPKT